jgi:hypothetical protein
MIDTDTTKNLKNIAEALNSKFSAPTVDNIFGDTKALAAINAYRQENGMTVARNPYSWWIYTLAALTYLPKGASLIEIQSFLYETANIHISSSTATLLRRAIKRQDPCPIRREYTKNLPAVANVLNLKARLDRFKNARGKRPYVFQFEDATAARKSLLSMFPNLKPLFAHIDQTKKLV